MLCASRIRAAFSPQRVVTRKTHEGTRPSTQPCFRNSRATRATLRLTSCLLLVTAIARRQRAGRGDSPKPGEAQWGNRNAGVNGHYRPNCCNTSLDAGPVFYPKYSAQKYITPPSPSDSVIFVFHGYQFIISYFFIERRKSHLFVYFCSLERFFGA